MNAEETREYKAYKVKNIQKTNRGGENIFSGFKPARYMADIKAQFEYKNKPEKEKDEKEEDDEPNVFFDSLKTMTPGEIVLNEAARNAKKPSFDFVRYFVLLVSLGVFIYAGYNIAVRLYLYVQAAQESASIQALMFGGEEDFEGSQSLKKTRENLPIKDHMALQKQMTRNYAVGADISDGINETDQKQLNLVKIADKNPDLYGWIRVSHTTINYPVVQTSDNDHYLYYSFEGRRNPSGAIFADHNNSRDIAENRNTVIYGHNMLDNSMFQPLIIFGSRFDYFKDGIIELTTEDATYYYEIFSAREEDPSSGYIAVDFYDDEQYIEFLNAMQERSVFRKYFEFDAETRIITLSTCVNDYKRDWRFVVQGILFDVR